MTMRVGFFYTYTTPGSEQHLHIAKYLLQSVRSVMPGVPVVQLTDETSDVLEGVDEVKRIPGKMPMAVRRISHHAALDGDWLFVDTDVVIQKDVRDVFKSAFDVAVTDRIGTEMEGTPYAKSMPFNMGVTFSRSPRFWEILKFNLVMLSPHFQQWTGDQMVFCKMIAHAGELGFNIKILPGRTYNYPPRLPDEDVSHASIVHYKGKFGRKDWLNETRATA